jgi:hypothetical protein
MHVRGNYVSLTGLIINQISETLIPYFGVADLRAAVAVKIAAQATLRSHFRSGTHKVGRTRSMRRLVSWTDSRDDRYSG